MKYLFLFFIFLFSLTCTCQNQARVEYAYTSYYKPKKTDKNDLKSQTVHKIFKSTEELSFELIFDGNKSLFKVKERMAVGNKSGSLARMLPRYYVDFKDNTVYSLHEMPSQTFFVKQEIENDWQITSEKKKIYGYQCKKAILLDKEGNKQVEAWFTSKIPVNIGPLESYGLPGLIVLTKSFNRKGEAYSGFSVIDIDFSKQKEIEIPDLEPITQKEYIEKTKRL
ncbi:GLPGLI family protein [Mesonia phycicola]|uniref:GLPGLI family protein n=1 Tax=Mesonia phycicola TaxID=579105 RepID=A0A1M6D5V2_9FLAO|nr:GLPGLI family protein [Mesonia phycicola]SHI68597.1 GLPGLI family protein [Mesonia phycicola]